MKIVRDHLRRRVTEQATRCQTSHSPPRLQRHSASRDELRSSHDLRHSFEHRRVAKPQETEPLVPISGLIRGNLDQVKDEILEQLRREIKGKGVVFKKI